MNREEFIKKLETASSELDDDRIMDIIRHSIDSNLQDGNPRGHYNLIIVMEEMGELIQQISKQLRNKGDKYNILEEVADVELCLCYILEICGIGPVELNKAINVKADRLNDVLNEKGIYQ
jgi:NTP pyrophosphatase (non-canonical NTP hydrolase)